MIALSHLVTHSEGFSGHSHPIPTHLGENTGFVSGSKKSGGGGFLGSAKVSLSESAEKGTKEDDTSRK